MKGVDIPERGFFYYDPRHKYFMDGEPMTGVTSIVDSVGDKSNLMQWHANLAAARAIMEAASMDITAFAAALAVYPKLDTRAANELDGVFPGFKAARTAAAQYRDAAADSGKEAHKLCELFELGQEIDATAYSEEAKRRARLYVDWYKKNVATTHFVERPLFSKEHFVGGTPDGGFALNDGRNLINDKKFKPYIYDPSPFRQMAAYRMMIEEMRADAETPVKIDWGGGRVEEYASPQEYLGSFGAVEWHGAVVIRIGENDFEEMYATDYETDKRGFLAALEIYRENGAFKNRLATLAN